MIGQTHGLSLRDERGAQGEIRVRIAGIELDTEAFGSPHSRRGTFIDRLHLQMRVARTISIALAGTDSLDVIGDQADQTADPCGVLWHASGGQSNIKLAGIVIFCGAGACAKGIDAHVATYIAAFAVLAIGSTEPTAALEQLVGGAAASAGPTERQTVAAGEQPDGRVLGCPRARLLDCPDIVGPSLWTARRAGQRQGKHHGSKDRFCSDAHVDSFCDSDNEFVRSMRTSHPADLRDGGWAAGGVRVIGNLSQGMLTQRSCAPSGSPPIQGARKSARTK